MHLSGYHEEGFKMSANKLRCYVKDKLRVAGVMKNKLRAQRGVYVS